MTPDQAGKFIRDSRAIACASMPYLTKILISLVPILDERTVSSQGVPTMGINESGQVFVHPLFLDVMKTRGGGEEALGFVLCHEALHLIFKHVRRGQKIALREGPNYDVVRAGIAADLSLNPSLREVAKARGTTWRIREPTGPCAGVFPEKYGLPAGLTYEGYYEALKGKTDPQQESQPGNGCLPGEGLSDKAEEAGEGQPALSEARLEDLVKGVVAEAKKYVAEKGRGSVPGGLLQDLEESVAPPKVRWEDELRMAISHSIEHRPGPDELSFLRTSNKQAGVGYGEGCARLMGTVTFVPSVGVLADTSGSMMGNMKDVVQETAAIADHLQAEIRFIACDTEVQAEVRVATPQDLVGALKGFGGTNMEPGLRHFQKNPPDLVVCITDGCIGSPGENPGFPVIWCLVEDCRSYIQQSVDEGWGRIVECWEKT